MIDRRPALRPLLEAALLYLAFFLPGMIIPQAPPASGRELTGYMLRFLWIAVPQILLMIYIIILSADPPPEEFGLTPPSGRDLLSALLFYGGLLALLALLSLAAAVLPRDGETFLSKGFRWSLGSALQLPLAVFFCLATGYREELFFRAYLLTRLTRAGLAPLPAVVLGALLFASGHLYQGVAGLTVALLQGVYFGLLFQRRRSLHALALAHALYNLTVLALTLLPMGALATPGTSPPGAASAPLPACLIPSAAGLLPSAGAGSILQN